MAKKKFNFMEMIKKGKSKKGAGPSKKVADEMMSKSDKMKSKFGKE